MSYRRYSNYRENKGLTIAIAVLLLVVLITGITTKGFSDFNPFCWFGHEYDEAGVCVKCEKAIEAEPNEEDNVTPEQTPGDTGATPSSVAIANMPMLCEVGQEKVLGEPWYEGSNFEDEEPFDVDYAGHSSNLDALFINGSLASESNVITVQDELTYDPTLALNDVIAYLLDVNTDQWYVANITENEPFTIDVEGKYVLQFAVCYEGGSICWGPSTEYHLTVTLPGEEKSNDVTISFIANGKYIGSDVRVRYEEPGLDYDPLEYFNYQLPEGYKCVGWKFADGTLYEDQGFSEDTTLYAELEKIRCTISLNVDGEVYKEIEVDYGTKISDVLSKNGLSFTSFETFAEDAEIKQDITINGELTDAAVFFAQPWVTSLIVTLLLAAVFVCGKLVVKAIKRR